MQLKNEGDSHGDAIGEIEQEGANSEIICEGDLWQFVANVLPRFLIDIGDELRIIMVAIIILNLIYFFNFM